MLSPTRLRPADPLTRRRPGALACALLACLVAAGCAAATALHHGRDAERRQDYDRAVAEYTKALRLNPDNFDARTSLERSRLRAAEDHYQRARRFAAVGKYEEALVEYQLASEMNPASGVIEDELRSTRNQLRAKISVAREGKTELQTLIERTRNLPPPGMDLPPGIKMPTSLVFRDASSREIFQTIARFADISLTFDPAFREAPTTVDIRNASLDDALNAVTAATRTFYRVSAPRTVIIVPDTAAKRREYEEEIVRTFYLSNADLKEAMDLLRLVIDLRRIAPTSATNALTIKDSPERIAAAARVLSAIDKAKPEVIIDVELLEVNRTKLLEYGLQIATPGSPGLNGSAGIDSTKTLTLQALRNLTQSDILTAGLPALYYRLMKTDTNTRTLANPQLRTSEGSAATAKFGEKVPVPVTTFAPIATGGTPQQPITSYQYENIGVNIDITPRTHHNDDVTLALKIVVTAISGTGFGGLPTFGNREINTVIRLRDGETNMLAGLIRDNEREAVEGVPGLIDLPLVGRAFGHTTKTNDQTDIVLTLTPHIIRVLDLSEADLRPFRVGRDSLAPLTELPLPIELPRQDQAPPIPAGATPVPVPTPGGGTPPPPPQTPGPIFGPAPTPQRPPG